MIMKYFYGVISTKWQQSVLIMYSLLHFTTPVKTDGISGDCNYQTV